MGKDQVPLGRVRVLTWVSETVDLKHIIFHLFNFILLYDNIYHFINAFFNSAFIFHLFNFILLYDNVYM